MEIIGGGPWKHCLGENVRGRPLVEILQPDDDDYFVLEPKHSGFFSTTLDTLFRYLGSKRLIMTASPGTSAFFSPQTTLTCATTTWSFRPTVLFPTRKRRTTEALALMRNFLKAETPLGSDVELRSNAPAESG